MLSWQSYQPVDQQATNLSYAAQQGDIVHLSVPPKRASTKMQFVAVATSKRDFRNRLIHLVCCCFYPLLPFAGTYLYRLCFFLFQALTTFPHHQLERVQREVFNLSHHSLALDTCILHMDFGENIKMIEKEQR